MTRAERYQTARDLAANIARQRQLSAADTLAVCNVATKAITCGESLDHAVAAAESEAARRNYRRVPVLVQLALAGACVAAIAIRIMEIMGVTA